jgi:hypothetical protein
MPLEMQIKGEKQGFMSVINLLLFYTNLLSINILLENDRSSASRKKNAIRSAP